MFLYSLQNCFRIKRADGTPFVGGVWPEGPVYFPDFSRSSTREWWIYLIVKFHDLLDWDALWIDMNEPANFGAFIISLNSMFLLKANFHVLSF